MTADGTDRPTATLAARAPTPAEREVYAAVRLHAVHVLMPYLATAVFRLRPCWVDGLGTMAVDARWRVLVDPAAVDRWGVVATAGVLLHEVGHALRGHAAQGQALGPALDRWAWNCCADAAINDDLVRSGVVLPGGAVLPADLRDRAGVPMQDGGTALHYYEALAEVAGLPGGTGAASPGRGAPGGVPTDEVARVPGRVAPAQGGCGGVADGAEHDVAVDDEGIGEVEQDLARTATASAVRAAAVGARGSIPSGLRRWADATLAAPAVDWRQHLRGAVRGGLATAAGRQDPTYARPSRRRVPGVVLPGSRRPTPHVACVVDTSASMAPTQLAVALTEVEGVARAAGAGCVVVDVDAAVGATQRVRTAADVVLRGGGGTDLRPGIAAALAGRPRPDVVVVLTDGGTPWDDVAPSRRARVVVVRLLPPGPAPSWSQVPPWASVVEVPVEPAAGRAGGSTLGAAVGAVAAGSRGRARPRAGGGVPW